MFNKRNKFIYILLLLFLFSSKTLLADEAKGFLVIRRNLRESLDSIKNIEVTPYSDTVYKELNSCYDLLEKKEYDEALAKTEVFLGKYEAHPLYIDALHLKAEILSKKNNPVDSSDIDKIYDIIDALKASIDYAPNAIYVEKALFKIGKLYQVLELPSDAIKYYKKVLEKYPESEIKIDVLLELGDIYYQKKEYEKCMDIFFPLYKREKGTGLGTIAAFYIGYCYHGMKNYERAAKYFLIGAHEDFSLVIKKPKERLKIGETFFQVKKFKKAIQVLTNLRTDYPYFEEDDIVSLRIADSYNSQKKYIQALEAYIETISNHPGSKGGLSAKIRMAGLKEKKADLKLDDDFEEIIYYNDPEKTYKGVIDEYPGSEVEETAINGLGVFYLNRKKYANAIKYFILLRDRFPNSLLTKNSGRLFDKTVYGFVKELYENKEYVKAIKVFFDNKIFLTKKFSFVNTEFLIGISYYRLHLYKEAEPHIANFLRKNINLPKNEISKKAMVTIFFKTNRPKLALRLLEKIKNPPLFYRWAKDVMANYYFEEKKYKKAIAYFKSIYKNQKKLQHDDMKNIFRYAVASQRHKDKKTLSSLFKKVTTAFKKDPELGKSPWFRAVFSKYGDFLYNEKKFSQAVTVFQKAGKIAVTPSKRKSSMYQEALSYFGMKKYGKGKEVLQSILKNNSDTFWQKQALFKLQNLPET